MATEVISQRNGGPIYQCGAGANNVWTSWTQFSLGIAGLGDLMNPYDGNSSTQLSDLKSKISSITSAISFYAVKQSGKLDGDMLQLITNMNALTEQTVQLDRKYTQLNMKESSMYVITIVASVVIISIFFIITK